MSSIHVQDIAQGKMLTLFGMTLELNIKAWGDTFISFKTLKEPMLGHKKITSEAIKIELRERT